MIGYRCAHPGLTAAELRELIGRLCGPETTVYGQFVDRVMLEVSDSALPLAPEGRAFNERAEVRWQQADREDRYAVLVFAEQTVPPVGEGWDVTPWDVSDPAAIYLLGVWQPAGRLPGASEGAWIEVRIPEPLPYPLVPEDPGRMARPLARAREYSQNGVVQHIRLLALDTAPVEEG